MKQQLQRAVAFFLACAAVQALSWLAFYAGPHTVFQLYDRDRQQLVLEVPAQPGDRLCLEIEHSFEHIPWYEYYTVTPALTFNLDAIAVAGYGAGIPAEMDVPTRVEGGLVWMEDINSQFPEFHWITSATYMKGLTLKEELIFDFRSLPDASRVTGRVILKRGYLSIG